jgi:hypothetical protein
MEISVPFLLFGSTSSPSTQVPSAFVGQNLEVCSVLEQPDGVIDTEDGELNAEQSCTQ